MTWEIQVPLKLSQAEVEMILKKRAEEGESQAYNRALLESKFVVMNTLDTPQFKTASATSAQVRDALAEFARQVAIEIERKQKVRA